MSHHFRDGDDATYTADEFAETFNTEEEPAEDILEAERLAMMALYEADDLMGDDTTKWRVMQNIARIIGYLDDEAGADMEMEVGSLEFHFTVNKQA
jgi:hypothetical protein